ncbi:hypothetical protein AK812_SmicGene3316 [Symbiodinium microadriaticum]|uniref:Uncharacterized protein n=1 Tax=Symbiodinium microadriaticum TaxID=2951 RepID=A0A1Q9EZ32_SYMMI|nr:hypothetical protein AK812_SmicGene3316 [Symbiodinium microadriaticum]
MKAPKLSAKGSVLVGALDLARSFIAPVEDIVIYHFFYGAWLEAEVAMQIEVKDRETFDIFYNTSCGREPQACEERRKQRIQDHLAANRRGDVRNHTERECISLPYEDLDPVVA